MKSALLRSATAVARDTIARRDLIAATDRVLVAFSGGPDSTALALILRALEYDVVLGHVDHGLRPDSADDARSGAAIASELDVRFVSRRVTVDPPTEAQARKKRYEALEDMASEVGAVKIATGHTLDDQAETVLMRLGRGGKPIGIPYSRGIIVRPILDLRRSDTVGLCRSARIQFLVDPSNVDERFTRNLIRNRVFPKFSDEVIVHLAGAGRRATQAKHELDEELMQLSDGHIAIVRSALTGGDARGLLRGALRELELEPSERLITDLIEKVVGVTGATFNLPEGWIARVEPSQVVIERAQHRRSPAPVLLEVPGTTRLSDWGFVVTAGIVESASEVPSGFEAHIDWERIGGRVLVVRSRQAGDRFRPLGMEGTKKIQDFLVDAKVPRVERDRVPIVVAGDEIIWVVGHQINDRFKLTEATKRILILEFARPTDGP